MTTLDPEEFALSQHAMERAFDMLLEPQRIVDLLSNPSVIHQSDKYPNRRNYLRGNLIAAVAHDVTPNLVVTFLWSSERAARKDLSAGASYGRELDMSLLKARARKVKRRNSRRVSHS